MIFQFLAPRAPPAGPARPGPCRYYLLITPGPLPEGYYLRVRGRGRGGFCFHLLSLTLPLLFTKNEHQRSKASMVLKTIYIKNHLYKNIGTLGSTAPASHGHFSGPYTVIFPLGGLRNHLFRKTIYLKKPFI